MSEMTRAKGKKLAKLNERERTADPTLRETENQVIAAFMHGVQNAQQISDHTNIPLNEVIAAIGRLNIYSIQLDNKPMFFMPTNTHGVHEIVLTNHRSILFKESDKWGQLVDTTNPDKYEAVDAGTLQALVKFYTKSVAKGKAWFPSATDQVVYPVTEKEVLKRGTSAGQIDEDAFADILSVPVRKK